MTSTEFTNTVTLSSGVALLTRSISALMIHPTREL